MMKPLSIPRLVCLLVFCFSLLASLSASPEAGNKSPVLLTVMQHELQRAKVNLGSLQLMLHNGKEYRRLVAGFGRGTETGQKGKTENQQTDQPGNAQRFHHGRFNIVVSRWGSMIPIAENASTIAHAGKLYQ